MHNCAYNVNKALSLSSDLETRDFGLEIIRHRAESLLIVHMDNEE